jgi:hypothetical protein
MRKLIPTLLLTLLAGSAMAAAPDYSGQYQLADGRVLTVKDTDGKLTAQIARAAITQQKRFAEPKEIVLTEVGPDRFRSTSTPLEITFAEGHKGDIAQVSVNEHAPREMMAGR